mmetsp:Transcript_2530/g.3735  ORF Transcript_2530/g.3735 Transcript_2530/m.3735 type:complete len:81 (-) Transcript_2530:255-497(-)
MLALNQAFGSRNLSSLHCTHIRGSRCIFHSDCNPNDFCNHKRIQCGNFSEWATRLLPIIAKELKLKERGGIAAYLLHVGL